MSTQQDLALKSSPQTLFSRLALIAFALAFLVILLGAYTRLTNAGLSCPDWPRCYGYLTPPSGIEQLEAASSAYPQVPVDSAKAWTEMRHRYLAGVEGLLILTIVSMSWYWRKSLKASVFYLSQSLIGIMIGQILLGMLTVTALLKPVVVLGHLLFGFSLMSILWIIWLLGKKPAGRSTKNVGSGLKTATTFGLLILILQITLGGWVSTHYAGLACIDLPFCNGKLIPELNFSALNTDLITIHMLHRIGAVITFFYLSLLSLTVIAKTTGMLRHFGYLILTLVSLQFVLGILNILWLRPVDIALPHHAVAALLLLSVLALRVRLSSTGSKS